SRAVSSAFSAKRESVSWMIRMISRSEYFSCVNRTTSKTEIAESEAGKRRRRAGRREGSARRGGGVMGNPPGGKQLIRRRHFCRPAAGDSTSEPAQDAGDLPRVVDVVAGHERLDLADRQVAELGVAAVPVDLPR